MRQRFIRLYRFLPVQLVLLHFRKYQVILIFWIIMFAVISGHFATHFGALSLFLSPEYLGEISFPSFFLSGVATTVFIMSWHITTFIVHSKRIPFLGATRHSFLKYCINNSLIPFAYLVLYGLLTARYLWLNETISAGRIMYMLSGFYTGHILLLLISFAYFFRVDRDIIKTLLTRLANPSRIRGFIPYDSLDKEYDILRAESYLSSMLRVKKIAAPYEYNTRFLNVVLRRHHRNAMFAIFIAIALLLIMGIFMDNPVLRIPAGAGFLILFSVMMTAVGAFKYFLRSWEIIGWLIVFALVTLLVKYKVLDLGSIAYGIKYNQQPAREYNYQQLKNLFTDSLYANDKALEILRLEQWKTGVSLAGSKALPPLVILAVSGGGSRSAYWTFRCLQYADSLTRGNLFKHTVLITGASGGMIGAAQWRAIHTQYAQGRITDPYDTIYQQQVGKDLLNAVIFSLACVDIISPFNKITFAGERYKKDRGYAFDRALTANTNNLLGTRLIDYQAAEAKGISPLLMINGTIINDGRKLIMTTLPASYMTRSENSLKQDMPIIDGVDYARFFAQNDPLQLQLSSALRMSATFPVILPTVELPSVPKMNIMDAGLRDNFGLESSVRYLSTFKEWLRTNTREVILIQIRDTRQHDPYPSSGKNSLYSRLLDPIFAIQNKWAAFQTFNQSYLMDYVGNTFSEHQFKKITFQYIPADKDKSAALNLHLTGKEKQDLYQSVMNVDNQKAFNELKAIFEQ